MYLLIPPINPGVNIDLSADLQTLLVSLAGAETSLIL